MGGNDKKSRNSAGQVPGQKTYQPLGTGTDPALASAIEEKGPQNKKTIVNVIPKRSAPEGVLANV